MKSLKFSFIALAAVLAILTVSSGGEEKVAEKPWFPLDEGNSWKFMVRSGRSQYDLEWRLGKENSGGGRDLFITTIGGDVPRRVQGEVLVTKQGVFIKDDLTRLKVLPRPVRENSRWRREHSVWEPLHLGEVTSFGRAVVPAGRFDETVKTSVVLPGMKNETLVFEFARGVGPVRITSGNDSEILLVEASVGGVEYPVAARKAETAYWPLFEGNRWEYEIDGGKSRLVLEADEHLGNGTWRLSTQGGEGWSVHDLANAVVVDIPGFGALRALETPPRTGKGWEFFLPSIGADNTSAIAKGRVLAFSLADVPAGRFENAAYSYLSIENTIGEYRFWFSTVAGPVKFSLKTPDGAVLAGELAFYRVYESYHAATGDDRPDVALDKIYELYRDKKRLVAFHARFSSARRAEFPLEKFLDCMNDHACYAAYNGEIEKTVLRSVRVRGSEAFLGLEVRVNNTLAKEKTARMVYERGAWRMDDGPLFGYLRESLNKKDD